MLKHELYKIISTKAIILLTALVLIINVPLICFIRNLHVSLAMKLVSMYTKFQEQPPR